MLMGKSMSTDERFGVQNANGRVYLVSELIIISPFGTWMHETGVMFRSKFKLISAQEWG